MPEIFLPLAAIEAMLKDQRLMLVVDADNPRQMLKTLADLHDVPDWVIAGLNCKNDADILPVCVWTFLLDWKPEVKK
jgi:hypothetical protein